MNFSCGIQRDTALHYHGRLVHWRVGAPDRVKRQSCQSTLAVLPVKSVPNYGHYAYVDPKSGRVQPPRLCSHSRHVSNPDLFADSAADDGEHAEHLNWHPAAPPMNVTKIWSWWAMRCLSGSN